MVNLIAIEEIKIEVADALNRLFGTYDIEELQRMVTTIDGNLVAIIKEILIRHSCEIFGAERTATTQEGFWYKGVMIEVTNTIDFNRPRTLVVALLVREVVEPREMKSRTIATSLVSMGRFDEVCVDLPSFVACDDEYLRLLTAEVFAVGYNWMSERIGAIIRRAATEVLNRELYEYIRIMVTNKKALEGLLFSAAANEEDFVVLDDIATQSAMMLAQRSAGKLGRSAADIAIQMMGQIIPIKDSVIRDVANEGTSRDIELGRDDYYRSDDSFAQSLRAVWGNIITCFPIVTEGDFLLVCFFMTEHKEYMLPLLDAHKDRLRQIALARGSGIRKNLGVLRALKRFFASAETAELAGRFTGGFLHGYHL